MSFFRKLFGLKPKEYVDNTPYVPEIKTVFNYTKEDKDAIMRSRELIKGYKNYKKEDLQLTESESNEVAKAVYTFMNGNSSNLQKFMKEVKSKKINTNDNSEFENSYSTKEIDSIFDVYNTPHGQRDYRYNHTSSPATCKDFGNPNKHYTDWLNDRTNAHGNHVVDDAKERFNDYMEDQRRIWEDW